MIQNISDNLIKIDNTCDYIPVVSTITNLFDIFQKTVILPFLTEDKIRKNSYFTHLSNKSILRSIVLLIPGIGNIYVGLFEFYDKEYTLAAVRENGMLLRYQSRALRNDKEVALAAVRNNPNAFQYVGDLLINDQDIRNVCLS